MARYTNSSTGVTVSVDDKTANTLGAEWKLVGEKSADKPKAPARPDSRKSE